ncbi:MAG TPA: hypothetical protein VET25_07060 [Aestuariivirgaceae bacterium]|nr:hypothetical protein [Aestuariivirgaceae bacterium]
MAIPSVLLRGADTFHERSVVANSGSWRSPLVVMVERPGKLQA